MPAVTAADFLFLEEDDGGPGSCCPEGGERASLLYRLSAKTDDMPAYWRWYSELDLPRLSRLLVLKH